MKRKILFMLGPNLKYLGNRQSEIYGSSSVEDIFKQMQEKAEGYEIEMIASNCEGKLIDSIMEKDYDAIIINPGAYTHYSLAIYDALLSKHDRYIVEVHMTNVYNRDSFRHNMVTTAAADGVILGMGESVYCLAIDAVKNYFECKDKE